MALLRQQKRFSDAKELLDQLKDQFNVSPESARNLDISLAIGARDYSRAIAELELKRRNDEDDADSRITLARLVYLQDRNFDRAVEYLDEAEAIEPNSMALIQAKVAILKADGKAEEARQVLDDYVARGDVFGAYLLRAAYLASQGELEGAEKDYEKLTTFADQSTAVYVLLSNFYIANGYLDKAVETLDKGLEEHPADPGLERALIEALFRRNRDQEDVDKADRILTKLEASLPQDLGLMKIRAMQMNRQGTPESIEKARAKLKEVIALDPTAVDAHTMLIRIASEQGEYETARDLAVQAVGSNPDNPALLSIRSRLESELGNPQLAAQLARMAIKKDPNSVGALGALVNVAVKNKEESLLEEARTLIESGLAKNATNESLVLYRAQVLNSLEQTDMAISDLEAYCQTEQGGKSVSAIVTLADLYRIIGELDTAEQKIKQAEQLDPNSPLVINLHQVLASTIYQRGDAARAKGIYEKLRGQHAERYPENIRIYNDLAWILQESDGDYDAALDLANKGLNVARTDNDKLHLLDTRGTILFKLKRHAEAKADFEELVALAGSLSDAPDSRQAKALLQLGRTCAELGELDQAKEHINKALEIDQASNVFTPEERAEIAGITGK